MLQIQESRKGRFLVLALTGKLDGASYEDFADRLTALIEAGERRVVLDLSALTYVNSMGLRTLGTAARTLAPLDGCLALVGTRGNVAEVLTVSGFIGVLPSFPTLEEAERAIR